MRHAIFGASGFIGTHLRKRLIERGDAVFAFDAKPVTATEDLPVAVHRCDVMKDLTDPEVLFGGETIDVAYYLSQSDKYRTFPSGAGDVFDVAIGGALRAAEAAACAGAKLFIYGSTGSMYAPSDDPLPETAPIHHHNPFALSKLCGEEAILLFHRSKPKMQVLSARMFGVYGPGQKGMLVQNVGKKVIAGDKVKLLPHRFNRDDVNGLEVSLMYVGDLLTCFDALVNAAMSGHLKDRVLNLASPEPATTRSIAESWGKVLHKVVHYSMADRPREGDLIADVTRLGRYLEIPHTPMATVVEQMIAADKAASHK